MIECTSTVSVSIFHRPQTPGQQQESNAMKKCIKLNCLLDLKVESGVIFDSDFSFQLHIRNVPKQHFIIPRVQLLLSKVNTETLICCGYYLQTCRKHFRAFLTNGQWNFCLNYHASQGAPTTHPTSLIPRQNLVFPSFLIGLCCIFHMIMFVFYCNLFVKIKCTSC